MLRTRLAALAGLCLLSAPALTQAEDRLLLTRPETPGVERLTAVFPGGRALSPAASPAAVDALVDLLLGRLDLPGATIELELLPGALALDLKCPPDRTVDALEELARLLTSAPAIGPELELVLTQAKLDRDLTALAPTERLERGLLGVLYDRRLASATSLGAQEHGALEPEELASLGLSLVSGSAAYVRLETSLDPAVALPLLEGFTSDLPDLGPQDPGPAARPAPGPLPGGQLRVFQDPHVRPGAELLCVLAEGEAPINDPQAMGALGVWLEWVTSDEGPLGSRLEPTESASYRLGYLELGRPALQVRLKLSPTNIESRTRALFAPLASPDLTLPTAAALARAAAGRASAATQAARLNLAPTLAAEVVRATAPVLDHSGLDPSGPEALTPERARDLGLTWCAPERLWLAAESEPNSAAPALPLFQSPWERTAPDAREVLALLFEALGGEEPFSELQHTSSRSRVTIQLPDGELELELLVQRRFRPFGHRLEQTQAGRQIVMRIVEGRADRSIDGAGESRPTDEMWQLVGAEERGLERLLWGLAQRGPIGARLLRESAPDPEVSAPQSVEDDGAQAPPLDDTAADPESSSVERPSTGRLEATQPPSVADESTNQDAGERQSEPLDSEPLDAEPLDPGALAAAEAEAAARRLPAQLELFDARGTLALLEIGADGLPTRLTPVQPGPVRQYLYSEFSESVPRLPLRTELPRSRVTEVQEFELNPELAPEQFEPR